MTYSVLVLFQLGLKCQVYGREGWDRRGNDSRPKAEGGGSTGSGEYSKTLALYSLAKRN